MTSQHDVTLQVFRMGNEQVPDMSAILDTHFSEKTHRLETYQLQVPDCNYKDFVERPPLVSTCDTQRVQVLLRKVINSVLLYKVIATTIKPRI